MSERDNESFDLDEEFLATRPKTTPTTTACSIGWTGASRNQGKKGKAAWSKLEEVLADRKLEKDLKDAFEDELVTSRLSPSLSP